MSARWAVVCDMAYYPWIDVHNNEEDARATFAITKASPDVAYFLVQIVEAKEVD